MRIRFLALVCALFIWILPAHGQNYYEASVGPATHYITDVYSVSGCPPPNTTIYQVATTPSAFNVFWGTLTMISSLPLLQKDGQWLPQSASATEVTSLGIGQSSYTSTLSANGVVTTVEQGSFSDQSEAGSVFSTETLDLNTGKYSWDRTINYAFNGHCTGGGTETQLRHADLPITLSPATPPSLTLSFANPFAYFTYNGPNPASVDENLVLSSPSATGLAADGESAAVVVVQSSLNAPVTLTLTAPGLSSSATGPFGSLAMFDQDYLSNPSPSGTTDLANVQPASCDSNNNCVFLALLWAPPTIPVSEANLNGGGFFPVTLNLTATQGSNSVQSSLTLEPPPLLLVHGVWSNAAAAWGTPENPEFLQWLGTNYPTNLIETVDYGPYNSLAFSDPHIQGVFLGTLTAALSDAANQGVAARSVDVVAHSMGGLVTRYFLDQLASSGPASTLPYLTSMPVHKLITIGTPHNGSPFATTLWNDQNATLSIPSPTIQVLCLTVANCTLGNFMGFLGRPVDAAVQSLEAGIPSSTQGVTYDSIVGNAPPDLAAGAPGSLTEAALDLALAAFVPGETVTSVLGTPNDTIVPADSQSTGAQDTSTVSGIVHTAIVPTDTGETASSCVWNQALYWLMGGTGSTPFGCSSSSPSAGSSEALRRDQTTSSTTPVLNLTGYTQAPASNISFSPASGSTLTINSPASITATSTKTITEVLLFQTVSDPTDVPLLYSTESPFTITFAPTRMGSANFVAIAVFNDMTFAAMPLQYTLQPSGNPLDLTLVNAPSGNLPVGSSIVVTAQAGYSTGPVNVTSLATYNAQSGTSSVFSVGPGGVLKAAGSGVDWLNVSYNGVTASAQVMVGSCTYSLSPVNQIVDSGGGSVSVEVSTADGCAWSAGGGDTWLTFTNQNGSGSGTITLTASPNTTGANQTAFVTVANQDVAITQPAGPCTYDVSPTQINAPAGGTSGTLSVTTSCPVVASSDASWVDVANLSSSVAYTVTANSGSSSRSGTITVGTQTVQVMQAAAAQAQVSLTPTTLSFSGQAVGSSSPVSAVTLKNTGSAPLTITALAISGPNAGDFAIQSTSTCNTSRPVAAGASCSISIVFTPSAAGTRSATLTITDNAANSPQMVSLTGTDKDFSLTAASGSTTSATVSPGQTATYNINVTPEGGLLGTVSLSCSGAPSGATCTFNPSSVSLNGSSNASTTVSVATAGTSLAFRRIRRVPPGPPSRKTLSIILGMMVLLALAALSKRGRIHGSAIGASGSRVTLGRLRSVTVAVLGTVLLGLSLCTACGGGGGQGGGTTVQNAGTPAGSYSITVTATDSSGSSTLEHSITLGLTVK
jgi:pimeloyl-ACP methyl ester carboxylesterase